MFHPIIGVICFVWSPVKPELQSRKKWNHMSIAFVHFGCALLLMTACAIALSV
jgi:hydrogenase-4 membrane subunit HyfE